MSELWIWGLALYTLAIVLAILGVLLGREAADLWRQVQWWSIKRQTVARRKALDREWAEMHKRNWRV